MSDAAVQVPWWQEHVRGLHGGLSGEACTGMCALHAGRQAVKGRLCCAIAILTHQATIRGLEQQHEATWLVCCEQEAPGVIT